MSLAEEMNAKLGGDTQDMRNKVINQFELQNDAQQALQKEMIGNGFSEAQTPSTGSTPVSSNPVSSSMPSTSVPINDALPNSQFDIINNGMINQQL